MSLVYRLSGVTWTSLDRNDFIQAGANVYSFSLILIVGFQLLVLVAIGFVFTTYTHSGVGSGPGSRQLG